jgi:hypothetical protein
MWNIADGYAARAAYGVLARLASWVQLSLLISIMRPEHKAGTEVRKLGGGETESKEGEGKLVERIPARRCTHSLHRISRHPCPLAPCARHTCATLSDSS